MAVVTRPSSSLVRFASPTRKADWASMAFTSPESRASSLALVSWVRLSSSTWLLSAASSLARCARSPPAHPAAVISAASAIASRARALTGRFIR